MDRQPLGVVNYNNLVHTDCNKGGNCKCHFGGFQQNPMHHFYHLPTQPINFMFLGNKFHFQ